MNGDIVQKFVSGHCPKYNVKKLIQIDYIEVDMCGTNHPDYKKGNYYCDELGNCPFPSKDEWNRCPVYLNAPSRPQR